MIQYIFVTFKDPCSVIMAEKLFKKESSAKKWFSYLTCKKSKESIEREFLGKELDTSFALDADNILWSNLSFTEGSSGQRQ